MLSSVNNEILFHNKCIIQLRLVNTDRMLSTNIIYCTTIIDYILCTRCSGYIMFDELRIARICLPKSRQVNWFRSNSTSWFRFCRTHPQRNMMKNKYLRAEWWWYYNQDFIGRCQFLNATTVVFQILTLTLIVT